MAIYLSNLFFSLLLSMASQEVRNGTDGHLLASGLYKLLDADHPHPFMVGSILIFWMLMIMVAGPKHPSRRSWDQMGHK